MASATTVSGTEPGQRQLNGPQTTGRTYRQPQRPALSVRHDLNVGVVLMRDGVRLLADVHRPTSEGRFPALVVSVALSAADPGLGAPMGFIEAGATDFWVPRGYVHVIASLRGTGGSGGEFGFFDSQERRDLYDLVEWAAQQSWCDGTVGMMGISYFAMTQLEAAVERPPHLQGNLPGRCDYRPFRGGRPPRAAQLVIRLPVSHHGRDHLRHAATSSGAGPFQRGRDVLNQHCCTEVRDHER